MKNKDNKLMILTLGGLMALGTASYAQDKDSKPADDKPAGDQQVSPPSTPAPRQRTTPEQRLEQRLTSLSDTLTLTDDQKPKVKAILEDQAKQTAALTELRRELPYAMRAKMKEVLTAEQYAKFEKIPAGGARRSSNTATNSPE